MNEWLALISASLGKHTTVMTVIHIPINLPNIGYNNMLNTRTINSKALLMEYEFIMASKSPVNRNKCSIRVSPTKAGQTQGHLAKHLSMLELKAGGKKSVDGLNTLSLTICCHSPLPCAVKRFDRMCVTGLSCLHSPQAFIVGLWHGHGRLVRLPSVTGSTAGPRKAPGNTIYHCHKTNHPHQQGLSFCRNHDTH